MSYVYSNYKRTFSNLNFNFYNNSDDEESNFIKKASVPFYSGFLEAHVLEGDGSYYTISYRDQFGYKEIIFESIANYVNLSVIDQISIDYKLDLDSKGNLKCLELFWLILDSEFYEGSLIRYSITANKNKNFVELCDLNKFNFNTYFCTIFNKNILNVDNLIVYNLSNNIKWRLVGIKVMKDYLLIITTNNVYYSLIEDNNKSLEDLFNEDEPSQKNNVMVSFENNLQNNQIVHCNSFAISSDILWCLLFSKSITQLVNNFYYPENLFVYQFPVQDITRFMCIPTNKYHSYVLLNCPECKGNLYLFEENKFKDLIYRSEYICTSRKKKFYNENAIAILKKPEKFNLFMASDIIATIIKVDGYDYLQVSAKFSHDSKNNIFNWTIPLVPYVKVFKTSNIDISNIDTSNIDTSNTYTSNINTSNKVKKRNLYSELPEDIKLLIYDLLLVYETTN